MVIFCDIRIHNCLGHEHGEGEDGAEGEDGECSESESKVEDSCVDDALEEFEDFE